MASYAPIIFNVAQAVDFIAEGRVVAVPTGTAYALAADALQGWALQRVRVLKQRSADKTFTVFMADNLWGDFLELTDTEQALLQLLQNQPLTLLVKPQPSLAHVAQDGLVGLRVIDHPLMRELAALSGVPLTATSANRSGMPACFTSDCIETAFPGLLPDELLQEEFSRGASGTTYDLSLAAILGGGQLPPSLPTTIAKIVAGKVKIVRSGSITADDLQQTVLASGRAV